MADAKQLRDIRQKLINRRNSLESIVGFLNDHDETYGYSDCEKPLELIRESYSLCSKKINEVTEELEKL